MERKARLESELASEMKKLEQLKKDVQAMEKDLKRRNSRGLLHTSEAAVVILILPFTLLFICTAERHL
jgi:hypothetical protein